MAKAKKNLDFTATLSPSLLNSASRGVGKTEKVIFIPREEVEINPINARYYPDDEIESLAIDISERGIQNPCSVYPIENGHYRLLSGHRRRAANEYAVENLGYIAGAMIPCLIQDVPASSNDEREQTIKNNLQRDKSDYSKMMEIVDYKVSKEERKALGEPIQNVRDLVCSELGVSSSEITRYEKIHDCLDEGFFPAFKAKQLSANVAYELSRMDDDMQAYVLENWAGVDKLTLPTLNILAAEYRRRGKTSVKQAFPPPPVPATVDEGMRMINEMTDDILSAIKGQSKIPQRVERKLLTRLIKQTSALASLKHELSAMGLIEDEV